MAHRSESLTGWIARALATYSLAVYGVGLLAIVLTRVLEGRVAFPLPARVRQATVIVALAVMVVTYLAERRYAGDDEGGDGGRPSTDREYSLYARGGMAAAALGVAAGIYVAVALERVLVGALFILGAYLFVYMAYRHEGQGAD